MGTTNSGKSTVINAMLLKSTKHKKTLKDPPVLTESALPGTT
jgi:ribosome biogenesis GTPase A